MSSLASALRPVKPSKPLQPVHVLGRLITGLGTGLADLFDGCAILEIDDGKELTSYWCLARAESAEGGQIVSLHLQKFGSTEKYDLPASLDSCDCADGTYRGERPGGCRHQVALRQALVRAVRDNPAPRPLAVA
jgi:hypothetical protein